MAPQAAASDSAAPERPILLNEKFKVHSYDGGSFKSRAQYDIKNVLVPILEPFHCSSSSGTKFNLVLKCPEDFTLTHFYISGPGPRCTEPIRSGLVWVTDDPPEVDAMKLYDNMTSEELMEIMKGLRQYDESTAKSVGLPEPCVYFTTDATSRESEVELSKWREGKYVAIKFLDTHKDQVNIDVGIVALIGFFGRHAKQQVPFGPWMRRTARQVWVHPNQLKSMFSSSGWVCDGRDFTGGCRSGQTDFHQTSVYTVTFRCTTSGFDLCEKCAHDPTLGKVTETSLAADLEALADPATCKLAVTRLRNLWRRNWPAVLPRYFDKGLLDVLIQALQKSTESGGRPDEERVAVQRQQGPETQKRQVRRALLQLTTELTQRLLCLGPGGDLNVSDLVWALNPEPEEHWEEGRIVQLPKTNASGGSAAVPGEDGPLAIANASEPEVAQASAAAGPGGEQPPTETASPSLPVEAAADAGESTPATTVATVGEANNGGSAPAPDPNGFLISWRDGGAPGRVAARNVWKMTADEDVMMSSAGLFLEVSKGEACDISKVQKFLQQGADLMAANGEGNTTLLMATKAKVSIEVLKQLLENGACPDVTGHDGITPMQLLIGMRSEGNCDPSWITACMEALQRHGATPSVQDDGGLEKLVEQLRETWGLKMVGSLLTLQTPLALPVEVLEVLHLLLRELPLNVVKQSLEPQSFRALTALLQHFVGGTDSLSTAVIGCRIMRALINRPDPTLQYLVRSHGAMRWAQRLSTTKDVAQCGLYRQPHHEKVTPEELSKEAKALLDDLVAARGEVGGDFAVGEEWRENTRLAEIVTALEACGVDGGERLTVAQESLLGVRELLKKTEKGNITEERCAAFELEKSHLPGLLLRFLKHGGAPGEDPLRQPSMNSERWAFFREAFSEQTKHTRKGLARLMKAMHAVIETGEAFPVWRHKKERGLRALTEPLALKLRHFDAGTDEFVPLLPQAMRPQVTVSVEPLVPLTELARYLLRITPRVDDQYLAHCHTLVGAKICDPTSGDSFLVRSFEVLYSALALPIHTVENESSGESQRVLLGVRDYTLASASTLPVTALDFRVSLCKLLAVAGPEAYPASLESLGRALRGETSPPPSAPRAPADVSATGEPAVGDAAAPATAASTTGTEQDAAASTAAAVAADAARATEMAQKLVQQIAATYAGCAEDVLAVFTEELHRVSPPSPAGGDAEGGGSGEMAVEPSMRVHTVMIAVSEDIPFELFWPMVRDDIMGAVRELYPRAMTQMEEAVQAGVQQNGMGPIAQRLTLEEAEMLAARVGHVVQTAVTVCPKAVEDLQKERTKATAVETIPIAGRVQFSPKGGNVWVPGVVVGYGSPPASAGESSKAGASEKFDLIDDQGVLWEKLPRGRVRIPPQRRESPSAAGTPIQAVLSQADLMRIREHLRRRQEEWAERHAQLGAGGSSGPMGAASAGTGSIFGAAVGPSGSSGGGVVGGPSGGGSGAGAAAGGSGNSTASGRNERSAASRPTSAPAITQRPRASSVGTIEAPGSAGRRGVGGDFLSSHDGSLAEVDPTSALEMVHFIDEEGIGDEEFDDDGDGPREGEDGDEDDEDLPPLEPSEAGDSQAEAMPPPRLSMGRSRDGEPRDGEGASSMEEELRVLEQLRQMEQIISEVLDPQDDGSGGGMGGGRPRREPPGSGSGGAEDFLSAPMANLRIRMGGGNAEGRVETVHFRRAGGSRGSERAGSGVGGGKRCQMEAIRGDFPAFVRAADGNNPTSTLDHPVVERLGAADLVEEDCDEPMEPAANEGAKPGHHLVRCRFCLYAPQLGVEKEAEVNNTPVALPPTWNLLKAMQFLQDQHFLRSQAADPVQADAAASAAGAPPCVVQALQKVSLENWSLGYMLEAGDLPVAAAAAQVASGDMDVSMGDGASMEVDGPSSQDTAVRTAKSGSASGLPAKKRRRMLSGASDCVPDEVAREMYSRFSEQALPEGGMPMGPHRLIARCGDNAVVTDAIELLHLLRAQGPNLGVESGLWVSSKLDRKLRYQLEDPLSVVSGTLPFWATTLPRLCPFLFSLKTRKMLLKYTAFGPSFAVHWTQESKVGSFLKRRATVQTELNAQMDPRKIQELSQELSNIEEHVVKSNFWLGTLQSTLVRMQKGEDFLRQSDVALELVATASKLVEIQFDGETGFGSAVTQSFYVEVAQAMQDRDTNRRVPMWVEDDASTDNKFLICRRGLLIRPLVEGPQRDEVVRRFRFLGRLMGQALREGFIAPLPLAEEFFAIVLGEPLGSSSLPRPGGGTAGELVGVLADFAAEMKSAEANFVATGQRSPEEIAAWRKEQAERTDFSERFLAQHDRAEGSPGQPQMSFDQYVSCVGACFVETGLSGAPLVPGGDSIPVSIENLHDFVEQATNFWFDAGVQAQAEAFRAGLNDVFPFECLVAFGRSELREMFCGEDRIEWDEQALLNHIHPVGGLTDKSPTYKFLVAELLELSQADRSRFLDFVSSCPRLPPGGIAKFHVDVFPDTTATKQGFPRSRACANQLYLPPYTTKEELHEKLHEAMHSSAGHHEQRVRDS